MTRVERGPATIAAELSDDLAGGWGHFRVYNAASRLVWEEVFSPINRADRYRDLLVYVRLLGYTPIGAQGVEL